MFNEGSVSGLADITTVFNFSPRVATQVDSKCSHCSSILPEMFSKVAGNGSIYTTPLIYTQKKKLREVWSGKCGGQMTNPSLSIHCSGNLKFHHFFAEMSRRCVLLEYHVIGTLFFQNRHEKLTVSCTFNYITRLLFPQNLRL